MFKSRECFDRHKQNIGRESSVCASLVKCMHCNSVVKRGQICITADGVSARSARSTWTLNSISVICKL
jgi:hypothetical protein